MGNHGCENGINEKQSATDRQRAAPPTREAHVTLGDDRRKIKEPKFVGGKWKTEVGLGETRDRASEGGHHFRSSVGVGLDGDKSAFVEINGQASCSREFVQDTFQVGDMFRDGTNNN
jgi:hypothetical protein